MQLMSKQLPIDFVQFLSKTQIDVLFLFDFHPVYTDFILQGTKFQDEIAVLF